MFTTPMFSNPVDGLGSMLAKNQSRPARRDLPPEIREDPGFPDSCTARMSLRGHRRPCHERW